MNKKTYQAPAAQIIELEAQLPLAGSDGNDGITGNMNDVGQGQNNVTFESIDKGWSNDSWSSDEE